LGTGGRTRAPRAIEWLCALAALTVPHVSRGDGPDPQAGEIFRALQLERQLEAISQTATDHIDASAQALPPGDRLLLRAAVSAGFDPEAVRRLALDTLSARLDSGHADAALAWLARPETQALRARAAAGLAPARLGPGAHPGAEDGLARDALLRRFDRRNGYAARAEEDAVRVLSAMLRVANRLLPEAQRYTPREIATLLASQRGRRAAASPGPSALRERYRGIPTREIETALAFLESPAGSWLRREVDRALEHALVRAAEATAAHLVSSFGSGGAPVRLRMARATAP
jgi:hypothetical protein